MLPLGLNWSKKLHFISKPNSEEYPCDGAPVGQFDLADWNRTLVRAVFFDRIDSSPFITRIDATDNFLAQASGIESPAEARKSFLAAMPHWEYRVRRLFDSSVMYRWSTSSDDLPFYAQLHLTILAASAEESLQHEGNFRVRLAQMLDLQDGDYVSRGCLPALWENARQWSINRSEKRGDTRRLVLPDPGNETIIGYSKRLAFPGFRDQNRLAELFTQTDIDSSSALPRLLQVIRSNLFSFSDRFREEFRGFARLIESNQLEKASGTPFWDAIEETSWSRTRRSGKASRAGCRLEIDPTDPHAPGVWLFCRNLPSGNSDLKKDADESPYNGLVPLSCRDKRLAGRMLESLRSWAKSNQYRSWLGPNLEHSLKEGCIGFVQDNDGRWFDSPVAPREAPFWILLRKEHDWLFGAPVDSPDRQPVFKSPLLDSSLWSLFGPVEIDERVRAWLDKRVFLPDLLATRLARPSVTVVGSVRREDGAYFCLPPLIPSFKCHGAKSGVASIETGEQESSYQLAETGGMLNLPLLASQDVGGDTVVRISAFDASDKELARARFRFSNRSSALRFKPVRTPSSWLETGLNGRLEEFSPNLSTGSAKLELNSVSRGEVARPFVRSRTRSIAPLYLDPGAVDERWARSLEVLSAIFARRYALSLGECLDLMIQIWGTYDGGWRKIDELLQNGVLRQIHARHWSNQALVANPLSMVAHAKPDDFVVRALGLTSQAMRAIISGALGQPGKWISSPDKTTAGALEFHVGDEGALASLEARTGWNIRWLDSLAEVRLPALNEIRAKSAREDVTDYPDEEKRVWSDERQRFEDIDGGEQCFPRLEQLKAPGQRALFVVCRSDGTHWNTDSRDWALLVYTSERCGSLGEVLGDGSIVLAQPRLALPAQIGRRTVLSGGGVCFRAADGAFVYPSGSCWSPEDSCIAWIGEKRSRREKHMTGLHDATSRYAFVVEREKQKRRTSSNK